MLSTLNKTFVDFTLLNVNLASRRPPRTTFSQAGVAASGCVVGFFGLALLAVGARLFSFF